MKKMKNDSPTLRNISKEVFSKGYFKRARQRAKHRKSFWNIVQLPVGAGCMGFVWYGLFRIMWFVHTAMYPAHAGRAREFWGRDVTASGFLLVMPLAVLAVPCGLMLANCIMWCIPPARRAFEREAEGVKWGSFRDSMVGLGLISLIALPICLLLSFIGAATLKSLK